jgi:hypothetical protein
LPDCIYDAAFWLQFILNASDGAEGNYSYGYIPLNHPFCTHNDVSIGIGHGISPNCPLVT